MQTTTSEEAAGEQGPAYVPAGQPGSDFLDMVDQAWFVLDRDSFPRKQAIAIVENPWFDRIILSLIGINCLTMTMFYSPIVSTVLEYEYDGKYVTKEQVAEKSIWVANNWVFPVLAPRHEGCTLGQAVPCSIAEIIDFIFLLAFTIEMVIKMLSYGFAMHRNSYLRSGWNWLDFIVVIVGFVERLANGPGISTIRLVKVLRPLRSLQRIRGLRVLVQCILEALPQMVNVGIFLIFTLILFGLFGHSFFKGALRHSCHEWDGTEWVSTDEICDASCSFDERTMESLGCASLGNGTLQANNSGFTFRYSWTCREGQECRCSGSGEATPWCDYLDNPNYGITSFDSLPWAMVSLFQAISLEGWVDMMYQLQDGLHWLVVVYFILLVLFGAIIVMNLFLAVLCDNFEMAEQAADADAKLEDDVEKSDLKTDIAKLKHSNKLRQMCLNLVRWKAFDNFIQGCILFNTLLMCLKYIWGPKDNLYDSVDGDPMWDYMSTTHGWVLMGFNLALTAIFTLETIVKMIGLGRKLFPRDSFNIFDAFVVFFSIIEVALDLNSKFNQGSFSLPIPLSVLRAFRVFRLFKLVRSVESMRKIIKTLIDSLASVAYLALLLCLIILIFILLGMELFGGYYPHPQYNFTKDNYPKVWEDKKMTWDEDWSSRYNFDDFGTALLAIFVVLSGENWNEIMFNSHRAIWDGETGALAIIYFIFLFVIGNLLLFNLFIAILLSNFEDDEEEEEAEAEADAEVGEKGDDKADSPPVRQSSSGVGKIDKDEPKEVYNWVFGQYRSSVPGAPIGFRKPSMEANGTNPEEEEALEDETKVYPYPDLNADTSGDKSLKLFTWNNPFRRFCAKTIMHRYFEPVVLVLILTSTALLIIDFPHLSEKHTLRVVISYFNIFFTIVFTLEMLLKIFACGFIFSKTANQAEGSHTVYELSEAYMRSGWNILDFLIVIVSILALTLPPSMAAIKQLRALRAVRPMRLVSRYESLKVTFQTLLKSIPSMCSLMSVASLFFVIFGILGLELFGGKFGYCRDPRYDGDYGSERISYGMSATGQNDYQECMALPRYNLTRRTSDGILLTDMADMYPDERWLDYVNFPQWMYPQFGTFDNIVMSLLLLFEISALEGWPDFMHWAMDSDNKELYVNPYRIDTNPNSWGDPTNWAKYAHGRPPLEGVPTDIHITSNMEAAIFFVLWIIFGCFVIVNMTIGVVVDMFSQIKAENDGLLLMSEEEADWVRAQKSVIATRPLKTSDPPSTPWRLNFYFLVTSTKFEIFIMAIILLNMLQMGTDWFEPNPAMRSTMIELKNVMNVLNIVFFVIYCFEFILKWIGLGVKQYFKNNWNVFDFLLVLISLVDIIIQSAGSNIDFPAPVLRVLRLFRVARILRIVKTAKQLRTIMMTVYLSVPQLKNILVLMLLIIVIVDMLLVGFFFQVNYTPYNFEASRTFFDDQLARGDYPEGMTSFNASANLLYGKPYVGESYDASDDWQGSSPGTSWGDMVNRHANFATVWVGLLTLVRSSTGESFNGIMHDLNGPEWGHNRLTCCPQCGPVLDGQWEQVTIPSTGETIWRIKPGTSCGISWLSMGIYLIFQMVMAYIVLSIMIGIILENFANVGSENKKVKLEDIENFRVVWLKYDPKGTFKVPSHNLLAMLQQLRKPLGILGSDPPLSRAEMLKHLGTLDIPDHGGNIHFHETLTAVAYKEAGEPLPVCDTTKKMARQAMKVPKIKDLETPAHNALTNYLVSLLQSRWRGYAMRIKYTEDGADGAGVQASVPADTPQPAAQGKVKPNQVAPGPAQ